MESPHHFTLLIGKLCIEGDNNINDGIQLAHKVIQSFNLYSNNSNNKIEIKMKRINKKLSRIKNKLK